MSKVFRVSALVGLGLLLVANTGCARKKNKVDALQAQVNTLSDELVRLDQSVQEMRGAAHANEGGAASSVSESGATSYGGGVYRTPSGFELPSANIQRALQNAGYYKGVVDGKIGSATKEAVKAFQRDNGLEPDGVVGRRTWDKMKVHLGVGGGGI